MSERKKQVYICSRLGKEVEYRISGSSLILECEWQGFKDHALIFSGLKKTLNKFFGSEKILVYLPPLNFKKRVVHPHFSTLKI